jgi:hypothetical protein
VQHAGSSTGGPVDGCLVAPTPFHWGIADKLKVADALSLSRNKTKEMPQSTMTNDKGLDRDAIAPQ